MTRDAMKLLAGYYEKWRKTSMLCNNACRRRCLLVSLGAVVQQLICRSVAAIT